MEMFVLEGVFKGRLIQITCKITNHKQENLQLDQDA